MNYSVTRRLEKTILTGVERLPMVSGYAKTRGWPFVIAWIHRITGILLVFYVLFHVYTLMSLQTPEAFDAKMRVFRIFVFVFLEWALAVPVIFHALNGGRLILYEIFGNRNDHGLIRWMWALSFLYVLLLGFMMILGNQSVTLGFFWLTALILSVSMGYGVGSKIRNTGTAISWKLQRISGSFLLIMVPAHMIFMHLSVITGHDASVVIARMQYFFVKIVDLGLIITVFFHGGYGLLAVLKDYIPSKSLQNIIAFAIVFVMVVFAWMGIKLILLI